MAKVWKCRINDVQTGESWRIYWLPRRWWLRKEEILQSCSRRRRTTSLSWSSSIQRRLDHRPWGPDHCDGGRTPLWLSDKMKSCGTCFISFSLFRFHIIKKTDLLYQLHQEQSIQYRRINKYMTITMPIDQWPSYEQWGRDEKGKDKEKFSLWANFVICTLFVVSCVCETYDFQVIFLNLQSVRICCTVPL